MSKLDKNLSIKIEDLKVGDIIRHKEGIHGYVITGNFGNRVTAVRTVDITNPDEWIFVNKASDKYVSWSIENILKKKN